MATLKSDNSYIKFIASCSLTLYMPTMDNDYSSPLHGTVERVQSMDAIKIMAPR